MAGVNKKKHFKAPRLNPRRPRRLKTDVSETSKDPTVLCEKPEWNLRQDDIKHIYTRQ